MDSNSIVELTVSKLFDAEAPRYVIPLYQRSFDWSDDEISRLIEDIADFDGSSYFLGTLITAKKGEDFEVVDGQQRLTALFLLLCVLGEPIEEKLVWECREKSEKTLRAIKAGKSRENGDDNDLWNGKKIIEEILAKLESLEKFKNNLLKTKLYRIILPEHTDLNRYFEIMNVRGVQLEQQDILKATLMNELSTPSERALFARVWNACSDMTGYVQMHFDPQIRKEIFGRDWTSFPKIPAGKTDEKDEVSETLENIVDKKPDDKKQNVGDDESYRFESVVSFPHFLLHVLKVMTQDDNVPLDDKKLLSAFKEKMETGFSENFINCLLKCRYLFDTYVLKREYGADDDGQWSLKTLKATHKKASYVNTSFKTKGEWEKIYRARHERILMLQACLRVSYTSAKSMRWITEALKWLYDDKNLGRLKEYENFLEKTVQRPVKEYVDKGIYNTGVNTPHIVFNYLDYLLWKKTKEKFVFEFRNSVEHWYPQHPAENTVPSWNSKDGLDSFGNLCLLARDDNSRFSNLPPTGKKASYKNKIEKGSLKLRRMAESTNDNDDWKNEKYKEHEKEMLEILRASLNPETIGR